MSVNVNGGWLKQPNYCKVHEYVVQKFKLKCQEMTRETRMSSCRRKEEADGTDCTSSGGVFKIGAATGNER